MLRSQLLSIISSIHTLETKIKISLSFNMSEKCIKLMFMLQNLMGRMIMGGIQGILFKEGNGRFLFFL